MKTIFFIICENQQQLESLSLITCRGLHQHSKANRKISCASCLKSQSMYTACNSQIAKKQQQKETKSTVIQGNYKKVIQCCNEWCQTILDSFEESFSWRLIKFFSMYLSVCLWMKPWSAFVQLFQSYGGVWFSFLFSSAETRAGQWLHLLLLHQLLYRHLVLQHFYGKQMKTKPRLGPQTPLTQVM